jgi:hypothetical protein
MHVLFNACRCIAIKLTLDVGLIAGYPYMNLKCFKLIDSTESIELSLILAIWLVQSRH